MKKNIFLVVTILLSISTFSQSTDYTIYGKIIDANTKAPLQSASVFAQNTTLGTATNAEGDFKLQLPNGGYDLIITYTGFKTEIKRITTLDAETKLLIEINPAEKALDDVIIKSSNEVPNGWEKYGDFFMENFIGKSNNAQQCSIKNKEELKFYFYKKKNKIKVTASKPLEIINEALGYNIKYTLDSFSFENNSQICMYSGYPLFEEMQPVNDAQKITWNYNRMQTYKGSMLQFMRSVFNKQLHEDGFEIQLLTKLNNNDTALLVNDYYKALNYLKDDSTQTVEILPNQLKMAILYKNKKPEENYIISNPDEASKFQLSVLNFMPNEPIIIEQNGYYFDQSTLTLNQYLAWKKWQICCFMIIKCNNLFAHNFIP